MPEPVVRPANLPEHFYLARLAPDGRVVHDVMPWQGATEYVTDGVRYGVRFQDGAILWVTDPGHPGADPLTTGFGGVDLEPLIEILREYASWRPLGP